MNETQTIADKKALERAKVLDLEIKEQKVKLAALESKLRSQLNEHEAAKEAALKAYATKEAELKAKCEQESQALVRKATEEMIAQ